jgi:pyruvate-formate lyase-activating enzyme
MLVPGYNETEQVSQIAGFIASLDRRIPYALLAFVPHFHLSDLPCTSYRQAREAEDAAYAASLTYFLVLLLSQIDDLPLGQCVVNPLDASALTRL